MGEIEPEKVVMTTQPRPEMRSNEGTKGVFLNKIGDTIDGENIDKPEVEGKEEKNARPPIDTYELKANSFI